MVWTIDLTPRARKALGKIDRQVASRIVTALREIALLDDPRLRGHALVGPLKGLWTYRVGDWRVLARIEDERVVIVVVEIDNRSKVYRG